MYKKNNLQLNSLTLSIAWTSASAERSSWIIVCSPCWHAIIRKDWPSWIEEKNSCKIVQLCRSFFTKVSCCYINYLLHSTSNPYQPRCSRRAVSWWQVYHWRALPVSRNCTLMIHFKIERCGMRCTTSQPFRPAVGTIGKHCLYHKVYQKGTKPWLQCTFMLALWSQYHWLL